MWLALIGTGILEQNDLALLEVQPRLLREEQVGTFDNVLEMRLALRVNKGSDIRDVDSLRSAQIRLNSQHAVYHNHKTLTCHRKARTSQP